MSIVMLPEGSSMKYTTEGKKWLSLEELTTTLNLSFGVQPPTL